MMVIGITGGSGTGKSTVAKAFSEFGGYPIDADDIYHRLLDESTALKREILERFPEAQDNNGGIDLIKLSKIVFSDSDSLTDLNFISHKYVLKEIESIIGDCYRRNIPFVIVDAIALFESSANDFCDITICVMASKDERVSRIMKRDGISHERALERVDGQPASDFYLNQCDFTIVNDGCDMVVENEVKRIYQIIMEGWNKEK